MMLSMRTEPVPPLSPADVARFFKKAEPGPDGCLVWTGAIGKNRYGKFRVGERVIEAHRVAYAIEHGQVPDGMVIDHRGRDGFGCRRSCVNPHHLEAVTTQENSARSMRRGEQLFPIEEPEQRDLLGILD
jgi:hypothetical protein